MRTRVALENGTGCLARWLRTAVVAAGLVWLMGGCAWRGNEGGRDLTPAIALYSNEIEASNVGLQQGFGVVPMKLMGTREHFQVHQVLEREGFSVARIETADGTVGWAVMRKGRLE